jgi:formylglycine-generating enzyme required for sulfatase activity
LPQAVIRQGLAQLAYGLNQRTELPVAEAERVLAQSLPSGTDTALLLRLAMAANLLEVEGAVRFSHQLLQEYFASAVLGEVMDAKADPSTIWPPDRWWEPSGREETTILLAGVRADPEQVARWLAPAQPWFALELLQKPDFGLDLQKIRPETRLALVQAAKAKTAEPNPVGRAAAYRVLGVFDADDRFGLGLGVDGLPEFDWVDIPAGEFLYGDDKQLITLKKPFQISRYPVTYRQFQAFIDAPDGFRDPRWWDGLAADDEHKSVPRKQDFKFWNHPCDNVSWYDTIAFCRWLSYKLGGKWGLDELDEWPVRLPTEFEWEKAARGTDGREYSYEGEFDPNNGNGKETGIGQTSAVGMFSDGASPYGLLDMSGNVWEWCLSAYQNLNIDVPHENLQRADNRVRRGGSWDSSRGLLRAANRFSVTPFLTNSCYGFRCARSSRTE